MSLPTTFATLTTATGAQLDGNFAALGALTPIPCIVAGSNALSLTPSLAAPTVVSYLNYGVFTGVAVSSNTGAVTATVGALTTLSVFKDTPAGPVALTGGEIRAGNLIVLFYDSALNGFHLINYAVTAVVISGTPVSGQIAQWTGPSTLQGLATTGTGSAVLATSPTLNAAVLTTPGNTFATLPAASALLRGARSYITDASVSTASVGGTITGGGANILPVFCNGTAWVYG